MKVIFDGEPQMSPWGDDGEWVLNAPFLAKVDREDGTDPTWLTVPRGFITDLASVPKFLPLSRSFLGGKARRAAILHDYLYVTQAGKEFADDVFMAAMKAEKVNGLVRALFFTAVHWFGGGIYDRKEDHEAFRVAPDDGD